MVLLWHFAVIVKVLLVVVGGETSGDLVGGAWGRGLGGEWREGWVWPPCVNRFFAKLNLKSILNFYFAKEKSESLWCLLNNNESLPINIKML